MTASSSSKTKARGDRSVLLAAQPSVTRGQSYNIDVDHIHGRLIYASGRAIYLRDIATPDLAYAFTEHTVQTTVAKVSPEGDWIASGDIHGNVRIWSPSKLEDPDLSSPVTKHLRSGVLQGSILDMSWDSQGQRLLAVGEGREKYGHVFNVETGSSLGEISGHSRRINSCAIQPHHTKPMRAITASDDTSIALYAGPPFKYQAAIRQHTKMVQCVRYSPLGTFFSSCGTDGCVYLYDGVTNQLISERSPTIWVQGMECGHSSGVLGIAWEPTSTETESHQFATCSSDGTVKIWNIQSNQLSHTFTIGTPQVGCVWTGSTIISVGAPQGTLFYLDPRAGTLPVQQIHGHVKAITAMYCPKESDTFYTGSYDGRLYAWAGSDLGRGATPLTEMQESSSAPIHVQPPNIMVPPASTSSLSVVSNAASTAYSQEEQSQIVGITRDDANRSITSLGQDDQIRVLNYPTEHIYTRKTSTVLSSTVTTSDLESCSSVQLSLDTEKRGAPLSMLPFQRDSENHVVVLYSKHLELRHGTQVLCRVKLPQNAGRPWTAVCVSLHPIKPVIAVGGHLDDNSGTNLVFFEYKMETCHTLSQLTDINLEVLQRIKTDVLSLAYSPDGKFLAISDAGRQILILDAETLTYDASQPKWTHHTARIQCMAWHPNSTLLATGSLDTNIILWRVGKPASERKTILRAHQDGVNSLAFLNDNSLLSCGQDGCLRRWDLSLD